MAAIEFSQYDVKFLANESQETVTLKKYGSLDIFQMAYMAFEKTGVVGNKLESRYQKYCKKYASSSSLYPKEPYLVKILGITFGMIAFDYKTILEVNTSDAFSDRGPDVLLNFYTGGNSGGILMNNNTSQWKEVKKFAMTKMGQLSSRNRTSMLRDQLSEFLDRIENTRKETGNKIQVKGLFSSAALNLVALIIAGKKFSEDDPVFIESFSVISEVTDYHLFKVMCIVISGALWGLRDVFGYSRLCKLRDTARKLVRDVVNERESLGYYKDNPEVLVDFYLQKMETYKNDDKVKSLYSKERLVTLVQDLVITGMDSTSKFLESFIMFMALYPDVQCSVQREIDEVVGTVLPVYHEHKSRMTYTLATIYEVHRWTTVIPFIPRLTTRDVAIGGHRLKKGTLIATVMPAVRFDDTFWGDAFVFRPDRFLDANRLVIQEKVDRMLIFGKGIRGCPFESISPSVSFTFATGFLQKYSVKRHSDSEILGVKEDFGSVTGPLPFHFSVFDR